VAPVRLQQFRGRQLFAGNRLEAPRWRCCSQGSAWGPAPCGNAVSSSYVGLWRAVAGLRPRRGRSRGGRRVRAAGA